uniref:AAA+ ATPase domain-containing protein n=1 Tax=Clastoptera arizonana TaxID=38151 RepID=A0A1B6CU24_9HEMI
MEKTSFKSNSNDELFEEKSIQEQTKKQEQIFNRNRIANRIFVKTNHGIHENALACHIPHKNILREIETTSIPTVDSKFEPISGAFRRKSIERKSLRRSKLYQDSKLSEFVEIELKPQDLTTFTHGIGAKATHMKMSKDSIEKGWLKIKKKKPADSCDLKALIADLCGREAYIFYYLVWTVPPWSELYTPYSLKKVPYEEVDKKNFLTISTKGVTHHLQGNMSFTRIDEWARDYDMYLGLIKIKSFALYTLRKCFYVWHKNITWFKFMSAREYLSENLFIISPAINQALLETTALCYKMIPKTYLETSFVEKNMLERFEDSQLKKKIAVENILTDLREKIKHVVNDACHAYLLEKGYTSDDSNLKVPDELVGTIIMRGVKTSRDGKYRMTYVDRVLKEHSCIHLSRFIHMVDFIVQAILHTLVKKSLKDLLNLLQKHLNYLPSDNKIETAEISTYLEEPRTLERFKYPLFLISLEIKHDYLVLNPTYNTFLNTFTNLINNFEYISVGVPDLLSDPFFDPFTKPIICGRQEDRLCGIAPDLQFVLNDDVEIQNMKKSIMWQLHKNFDALFMYIDHFKYVHKFYTEDKNLNINTITEQTDLEQLRALLDRYHKEKEDVLKIVENQALGAFLLLLEPFKEQISPVPSKLLEITENTLPRIGRERIDALTKEADSAYEYLHLEPKTTLHFVQYLEFLEKIAIRVEEMHNELGYCKDLYDLVEEYVISVSVDDSNAYYDFNDTLTSLQNVVENLLNGRNLIVEQFNNQINKDISILFEELANIREEAIQPWLIDIESNPEAAKTYLAQLYEQLTQCQEQAAQYKAYQKAFKVEVSRFDILDEVMNDVKLRQLLWDSIGAWDGFMDSWTHNEFSTLIPEDINQTTAKYMKYITQFEKGLPENLIVPKLRKKVEILKDKLPVITTLRNPNLKPRHWMEIERVLRTKFSPEIPLTLEVFEQLNAFTFHAELQEISGQASSEAGLETLLRKVENAWKSLELIVLPHKETKDVYILGSTEEVQTALDESNINMNTIASSRHVGPIKPRVDDWIIQLELFSKTLDEWLECQTNWLYLEAIFSAPDIQKQLPIETKHFLVVDKSWKDIMIRTAKNPLALTACTYPGLAETFHNNNNLLDQILKCLEAYLESKRVVFPRFYFLSNEELIEILAQTRNPHAVQPHLRKCFDAISKLEFGTKLVAPEEGDEEGEMQEVLTTDIVAMISPENEKVLLRKGLKARGNVEEWLGKVEGSMFMSVHRYMKEALEEYNQCPRVEWVLKYPSQVTLTVSQTHWCKNVHEILDGKTKGSMKDFETQCFKDLNDLAAMVRGDLPKLKRSILCSLITIDVHARDIISTMVQSNVESSSSFEWQKQLRYYFEKTSDAMVARMASAYSIYGCEYLGASPRLVITPLTDKCYLCLMGALQLDLGGAPAGPAGTGKTETTKDLAKSLAVQCVVFNCSEGLDYKMMGRFFSGLAQSGAWCCFDEFNRIDIEVLSVIAQQLITIRNAKVIKAERFFFEGREIKLVRTCAAFITMNPGYAGRTELPDNLKSLFRPMAMMVPDYGLIAEVILYSEGFESSKGLAQKMVNMYKLCSEQLSQQDHYDFGMRAVKSVLVMAGSLKRENPDKNEDVVLICALRDSNLPKFLRDDALLFQGILSDLFPGIVLPEEDYGVMERTIQEVMRDQNLQPESSFITKVIQLYETMIVRHGVMTVGPTGGGKTTVLNVLKWTLAKLHELNIEGQYYRPVMTYTLNPKSVTMGELYGEVNLLTMEWRDGLLGIFVRIAVQCTEEVHQWVVCDGPVDAVWIENMNTVLDDNKMLCLANSERIKLTPWVHMLFEVQDLAQASPATVSRCGMVYIDPEELKWMPYVQSWLTELPKFAQIQNEYIVFLEQLFSSYIEMGFLFVKRYCKSYIKQVDISKISMLCSLFQSLSCESGFFEKILDRSRMRTVICQFFVFSYLWAIGGNLDDNSREQFESHVREQFEENTDARLPPGVDLWDAYMNLEQYKMEPWVRVVPKFNYSNDIPFFEMLVPTTDTVRFGYIMEKLLNINHHVLLTGTTGVGKSVIARDVLNILYKTGLWVPVMLNFSAQTSSTRTQEILESKLERKKKTLLGAPVGKKIVVFVDDVNMPKLETYGAQPPIELLRQFLDFKGFYDREKMFWKDIQDMVLCSACAPPGGGRNPLTPRFVRHFAMLLIPSPNESTLKVIFRSIIRGFLSEFSPKISDIADSLVSAAVEVYNRISVDLLPTPTKSHYVFNLRDLSKCVQGLLQADAGTMRESSEMLRLFYHECLRVFHDRLVNLQDKTYFYYLMREICQRSFATPVLIFTNERSSVVGDATVDIIKDPPILLFGDFMTQAASKEDRVYEEIKDIEKMKGVLQDYLMDFNLLTSKEMKLIFFMDAIEHVTRLARLLRAERGNGLLVGVGGMGKQSLTKLGAHLNGYKCFQIEMTRSYDYNSFHEDLRHLYFSAGALNEDTVFLFTDTQIVVEEFLEDINNILNTGEVANLFESDEYEKVIIACRPHAKEAGIQESNRDGIFDYFISRVRTKLHLVICMSPVGDAFRRRCRMFPSLVNCCAIDWFVDWPEEALLSVAHDSLKDIERKDLIPQMATMCFTIHESVGNMTTRFYEEMRRHYYVTPSSYLELLKLYKSLLDKKTTDINRVRDRIKNGLTKLFETNDLVATMKVQLIALEPQLKEKSTATALLMKNLIKEKAQADEVRQVVVYDEAIVKVKAAEIQVLADEAQRDLELALPEMEAAAKALEALNKNDINELRVFNKPPHLVKFVMEAVCLLLGAKSDWASAKILLGDISFLKRLQDYDKDHIPDSLLKKLKEFIDHPEFRPELVANQSKVCKSLCTWVRAVDNYSKIFRIVDPKRKRVEVAEKELSEVMAVLRQKQQNLAEVEAQIAKLEATYDASVSEKANLEATMVLCSARLDRAGRLTMALGNEQIRWEQSVEAFKIQLINLIGDVLLSAACVAYMGAFTSDYREELIHMWLKKIKELEIPVSSSFSLTTVLADSYEIRMWNSFGLPRDDVSTENAILVTQAGRWPLMIDPQEQANRWIRQMEANNNLKIVKLTDSNFMRILEASIRLGIPVLIEEVGQVLDPTLGPILLKQTFFQGGQTLIRLGDSDIEYDNNFRLYVTTKLANPHYLPEICIQVTLVNFTVTPSGLEDQLLADVVRLERPDLEQSRNELIVRINNDKSQLKGIEDKILKLLFASEGNILDDEELVEILNQSKETAGIIATRLTESEATEEKISTAREKYRVVASRGSCLYFVVALLANIDPMYQFSLKYFNQVFNTVITTSSPSQDLEVRLQILLQQITLSVYTNVSRGLFERHKLVFSFLLCINIFKQEGIITEQQWNFLIRGPVGGTIPGLPKKPDIAALSDIQWNSVYYLATYFPKFIKLPNDVDRQIHIIIGDFEQIINLNPMQFEKSFIDWNSKLNNFERMMLLKALSEEKLMFAITEYVKTQLGKEFVESPLVNLHLLYQDTTNTTPLVFVLSTGSDPVGSFQKFATETDNKDKIQSISLGQGQGPIAEKLIDTGKRRGDWVFLQNCHLASSWMLSMERIVLALQNNPRDVHPDFRLFLSSMPTASFPASILQNSVKVTNEPPKGLRANIKRAFLDQQEDVFEDHPLEDKWRKMIFGLCFFHAIVQERKKFGPLGWNIMYEFNDSDRECALLTLNFYCTQSKISWDALEYITGEITYGGRVTDYWDQRTLKTILKKFFSAETLVSGYKYSPSGTYYCPDGTVLLEYRNFIEDLPIIEEPEIFGMHENANIAYQTKETSSVIFTIMDIQPRESAGVEGKSSDDIVYELSDTIISRIITKIDKDQARASIIKLDSKGRQPSLTTVLFQEVDRFNKMLYIIHGSLIDLQKAIKGLVVMSEALEEVYNAFISNQVPKMWAACSYPSLKSLGSWIRDLELRLDFISVWLSWGAPLSFWLSGFFFPQGFVTGALQAHSRKYGLPIDQLKVDFEVTTVYINQESVEECHKTEGKEVKTIYGRLAHPENGVYIHGLFMDASRFDTTKFVMVEQYPGEMYPALTALHLLPVTTLRPMMNRYEAPLYKTSVRAGVLSTTGHSTNFVITVFLPTDKPSSHWILRGAALLTQITD